jgi:hypothetical protein
MEDAISSCTMDSLHPPSIVHVFPDPSQLGGGSISSRQSPSSCHSPTPTDSPLSSAPNSPHWSDEEESSDDDDDDDDRVLLDKPHITATMQLQRTASEIEGRESRKSRLRRDYFIKKAKTRLHTNNSSAKEDKGALNYDNCNAELDEEEDEEKKISDEEERRSYSSPSSNWEDMPSPEHGVEETNVPLDERDELLRLRPVVRRPSWSPGTTPVEQHRRRQQLQQSVLESSQERFLRASLPDLPVKTPISHSRAADPAHPPRLRPSSNGAAASALGNVERKSLADSISLFEDDDEQESGYPIDIPLAPTDEGLASRTSVVHVEILPIEATKGHAHSRPRCM